MIEPFRYSAKYHSADCGWREGQEGEEGGGCLGGFVGEEEEGLKCCSSAGDESSCCDVLVAANASVGAILCSEDCLVVRVAESCGFLPAGCCKIRRFLSTGEHGC